MIDTKKVEGRRQVRYDSLNDLLDDAKKFAHDNVRRLGNWSPGQIYEHLARTMNASIDGFDFSIPAPVRWLMALLMKNKILYGSMPPGYKSTEKFVADEISNERGLTNLANAIERQESESSRVPNPGFGKLSREEWEAFHLRHAEMHMSFLVQE